MAKKLLFETALNDSKDSDIEGIGTIRDEEDGKSYRWVLNNGNADIVKGSPMAANAYTFASGTFYGYGQEAKQAVDVDAFLGLAMTAIATTEYGWAQRYGTFADSAKCMQNEQTGATAMPIGQNVKMLTGTATATASGTGAFASGYQALGNDTDDGTAPAVRYGAKLLSATTATAGGPWDVSVFISAL